MKKEDVLGGGGLEIAGFVEDVVGGQQHFVLNELDGSVGEKCSGVGGGFARVARGAGGIPDDRGDGQAAREAGQFPFVSFHELGALDQVEGQITAKAEFGKYGEVGAALLGALGKFQNFGGISGEVADGGI